MMTTEMITDHANDTATRYGVSVPSTFDPLAILAELGNTTFDLSTDWEFLHAYGDAMGELVEKALGITPNMYPL